MMKWENERDWPLKWRLSASDRFQFINELGTRLWCQTCACIVENSSVLWKFQGRRHLPTHNFLLQPLLDHLSIWLFGVSSRLPLRKVSFFYQFEETTTRTSIVIWTIILVAMCRNITFAAAVSSLVRDTSVTSSYLPYDCFLGYSPEIVA